MIKNYFKTAIRNLRRNKGYAFINIIGLTVGIAAFLLIFLVIKYESSFDNFHKNSDRIYRVVTEFRQPQGTSYTRGSAFPVGKQLRLDYPQLEQVARINANEGTQVTILDGKDGEAEKKFKEEGLFFAEPEFFDIFNFPWVIGDPKTAIKDPFTAALTKSTAIKYFGDWKNAVGKTIKLDNRKVCKVTGILEDAPANTDFPISVVISFKTTNNDTSSDWVSTYGDLGTFVVVPSGMSKAQLDQDLANLVKKHKPAEYATDMLISQPLKDIHFEKRFGTYNHRTFSKELIAALTLIGIFLLIIACINFVNLATAHAVTRAKEVGVRKVLGSRKKELIIQFLNETLIVTLGAVLLAIGIAYITLPFLNNLLNSHVNMNLDISMIFFLVGIIIAVTLLSGIYPAFVMSRFNPITALKTKFSGKASGGITLRRALVVVQFAIAQVLIIGTLVVVNQMDYFKHMSLGFDKEGIVNFPIRNDSIGHTKLEALKNEMQRIPGVVNLTFTTFSITDNDHWNSDFKFENSTKKSEFDADLKWSDADVFKTFNLKLVAGRQYYPADTAKEMVVNETFIHKLGITNPEEAIGKKINMWDGQIVAPIVGVVKDFNSNTVTKPFNAVILAPWRDVYQYMSVKIESSKLKQAMPQIQSAWTKAFPDNVYEYQFLDDKIATFYTQETQLSQLYKIFAGIAIFISCLGLYGLISFMAVQKTKEVGIRKVLGASISNIVYMFSKEFTILIGIAFVIAAPVAWYLMNNWLHNFAFRVDIGVMIFLLTIVGSVLIAWISVGYKAIRAAVENPVKALRSE